MTSAVVAATAAACSGDTFTQGPVADAGGDDAPSGEASSGDAAPFERVGPQPLDLLFVVDNSPSMADKQGFLADGVASFIQRLVTPNCVDANDRSHVIGASEAGGICSSGVLEFPPVKDLHLGVVDTSLGGRGSDTCPPSATNPAYPSLNAHDDDGAHLVDRAGVDETPVGGTTPSHFLAWSPGEDAGAIEKKLAEMVAGVHDHGCGFEAQLESLYRFLVQPDPYDAIVKHGDAATLSGVDYTLLQQRHDFLRRDSVVGVVLLTDENDSTVDPLAFGARAWMYEATAHVKGGTTPCASDPSSPGCLSCFLQAANGDPACASALDDKSDSINVRFFHMKQRFGADPQFPLDRYVKGLTAAAVPDRYGEHCNDPAAPDPRVGCAPGSSFDYVGKPNCANPLFASGLPTAIGEELCHLAPGPRRPSDVFFAAITGVPPDLVAQASLDDAAWTKILGKSPFTYDFSGADPRMVESIAVRPGVPADFDKQYADLQFACTFPLPTPRDCTAPENTGACDCATTGNPSGSPLCDKTTTTLQIAAKAYPSLRELAVARALGPQAVVGSICALATNGGYAPGLMSLVDRMSAAGALGH